jgi:ankyrin repeat domain-containing protein 50
MPGLPADTRKRDSFFKLLRFSRSASPTNPQAANAAASNTPHVHALALPFSSSDPVSLVAPSAPSTLSSTVASTATRAPSQAAPSSPSITPARDLWFDALQTLSVDEQHAIQNIQPTHTTQRPWSGRIEELVSIIRTKQDECERKSYKFCFQGKEIILRDVAEKIVFWLDKFKTVGDIVVNFDPVHASLPWAGVRFLLQVLIGLSQ